MQRVGVSDRNRIVFAVKIWVKTQTTGGGDDETLMFFGFRSKQNSTKWANFGAKIQQNGPFFWEKYNFTKSILLSSLLWKVLEFW